MSPISSILAPHISMHQAFSKKGELHPWVCRLTASVLVGVMLLFSVVAVNQTNAHFKTAPPEQQEILQLIPTVAASDALIFTSFNGLPVTIYFFINSVYSVDFQSLVLTYALKESLFIPAFLRNPFYVFTSIHAP